MLSAARSLLVATLALALAGDFPLRAQPAEPDLAGTWTGQAVLTNDWPGFTCRYEGALSPPAVQLELTKDGHLDALTVHVECLVGASGSEDTRARAGRELAHQVKSYIGVSIAVEVHDPGAIERSAGKAKRLVDRRQK